MSADKEMRKAARKTADNIIQAPDFDGIYQALMQEREVILAAFIAKYGAHPDEVEQVTQYTGDGGVRWWVRRRGPETTPQVPEARPNLTTKKPKGVDLV